MKLNNKFFDELMKLLVTKPIRSKVSVTDVVDFVDCTMNYLGHTKYYKDFLVTCVCIRAEMLPNEISAMHYKASDEYGCTRRIWPIYNSIINDIRYEKAFLPGAMHKLLESNIRTIRSRLGLNG